MENKETYIKLFKLVDKLKNSDDPKRKYEYILWLGKKLKVPNKSILINENKELLFCAWDDKQLTKDFEGIPSPDISSKVTYKNLSLIFIPCLSVDKNLTRLGYGGGYFDRLRKDKNWRNIPCIGVLTSNCVSQNLLTRADWDIPLSGFITEKEILV